MGHTSGAVRIFGNGVEAFVNFNNALNVNIEEVLTTFTADYSSAQTNATIVTPTSGKRLHIVSLFVSTADAGTNITLTTNGGAKTVFKLYTSKELSAASVCCHMDADTDEVLKLTCGANTFVCINYMEHD